MAKAMGVVSYSIETVKDWLALDVAEILSVQGPVLIDIKIDSEEVPPMGSRVKVLRNQ